jgi:hypothetical protein
MTEWRQCTDRITGDRKHGRRICQADLLPAHLHVPSDGPAIYVLRTSGDHQKRLIVHQEEQRLDDLLGCRADDRSRPINSGRIGPQMDDLRLDSVRSDESLQVGRPKGGAVIRGKFAQTVISSGRLPRCMVLVFAPGSVFLKMFGETQADKAPGDVDQCPTGFHTLR